MLQRVLVSEMAARQAGAAKRSRFNSYGDLNTGLRLFLSLSSSFSVSLSVSLVRGSIQPRIPGSLRFANLSMRAQHRRMQETALEAFDEIKSRPFNRK